ncbi:hypothetical protein BRC81_07520 [Halobacteriales archaeon QS_1_68_20]|nr:MAG: hypothetical protein BRC81_07520 [Halobacteriales archaeon QS_1_68_20]
MSTHATAGRVGELSKGEIFTLLANARRRYVLHYLRRSDGTAELRELADHVAAWEVGSTVEGLTSDQRKKVYTSLQQTHLRKLDEAGIVEYDHEAGQVEATPAAEELEVYLEIVPEREFPWREYYLALGAVSTALVFVTWTDVGPFAALPDIALAGLIAGAMTVSAAAQMYRERDMRIGESGVLPDA